MQFIFYDYISILLWGEIGHACSCTPHIHYVMIWIILWCNLSSCGFQLKMEGMFRMWEITSFFNLNPWLLRLCHTKSKSLHNAPREHMCIQVSVLKLFSNIQFCGIFNWETQGLTICVTYFNRKFYSYKKSPSRASSTRMLLFPSLNLFVSCCISYLFPWSCLILPHTLASHHLATLPCFTSSPFHWLVMFVAFPPATPPFLLLESLLALNYPV